MSPCQHLCSDRLRHSCCCCYCCYPRTSQNPPLPVVLAERWLTRKVRTVAPFAYSTGGVTSHILLQKNTNKKSPADSQSDEGAGSSRRPLYLKTQTSSCLWNFFPWDPSCAAESQENSLSLLRLNAGRFSPKASATLGTCRTLSIRLNLNQFARYVICEQECLDRARTQDLNWGQKVSVSNYTSWNLCHYGLNFTIKGHLSLFITAVLWL